jgi:outer membrane protein OmpA-like peptidoglycan-associated protein
MRSFFRLDSNPMTKVVVKERNRRMKRYISRGAIRTTALVGLVTAFMFSLSISPAKAATIVACSGGGSFSYTGTTVDPNSGISCIGSAVIPDSITLIGVYAFSSATGLTSVSIGSGVTQINDYAFSGTGLQSISIPNNVLTLGNGVLESSPQLTTVTIGSGLTAMGAYTFGNSGKLVSVIFTRDAAPTVGAEPFYGAAAGARAYVTPTATGFSASGSTWNGLVVATKVNCGGTGFFGIENNVVTANSSCTGAVVIPSGVTGINGGAFNGAITSVDIPSSVLTMDSRAFVDARHITAFTVNAANPNFSSSTSGDDAGVLFNKDSTTLVRFPGAKSNTYVVPSSVTTIGEDAFYALYSMTSITLSSALNLTTIGNTAFGSLIGLTSLFEIPATVTSIGPAAFFELNGITAFSVATANANYSTEDGVLFDKAKTSLMYYPLANTRTSYTIPDTVTRLEESALKNTLLVDLTVPSSVTYVDGRNVYNSSVLRTVNFLGNAPSTVGYNSFTSNTSAVASITQCATGFPSNGASYYSFTIQVVNSSSCPSIAVTPVPVIANGYRADKLGTVYFAPGSSKLTKKAQKAIAAAVAAAPSAIYKVTGYVQKSKSSKNNGKLSLARAKAVETYLVSLGAGVNFTVVVDAGKVPTKNGKSNKARRATLYAMTPVVQ